MAARELEHCWHAVPLHYLPTLCASAALLSAQRLAEAGAVIRPRPSAIARKRKLGLADCVHLSLAPRTPLLSDKRRKGFPHALLAFPPTLIARPEVALLRYNTKRWAHRDDFRPVRAEAEKAAVLAAWQQGRYPSLEVLVPERLALESATALVLASPEEARWFEALLADLGLTAPPRTIDAALFPPGPEPDLTPLAAYAARCRAAGQVLPPPGLPFD
jgi:hypothetical protein